MLGSVPWHARAACAGSARSRARAHGRCQGEQHGVHVKVVVPFVARVYALAIHGQQPANSSQQAAKPTATNNKLSNTNHIQVHSLHVAHVMLAPLTVHISGRAFAPGLATEAICCVWVKPTRARVASGSGARAHVLAPTATAARSHRVGQKSCTLPIVAV